MDKQCKEELKDVLRSVGVTGVIVPQIIDEINEAYIEYRRRRVVDKKKWFTIFKELEQKDK